MKDDMCLCGNGTFRIGDNSINYCSRCGMPKNSDLYKEIIGIKIGEIRK